MRMMRYSYDIAYVPVKTLLAADALSRAPLQAPDPWDLAEEIQTLVRFVTSSVPIQAPCLQWLKESQQEDSVCLQLSTFCRKNGHLEDTCVREPSSSAISITSFFMKVTFLRMRPEW